VEEAPLGRAPRRRGTHLPTRSSYPPAEFDYGVGILPSLSPPRGMGPSTEARDAAAAPYHFPSPVGSPYLAYGGEGAAARSALRGGAPRTSRSTLPLGSPLAAANAALAATTHTLATDLKGAATENAGLRLQVARLGAKLGVAVELLENMVVAGSPALEAAAGAFAASHPVEGGAGAAHLAPTPSQQQQPSPYAMPQFIGLRLAQSPPAHVPPFTHTPSGVPHGVSPVSRPGVGGGSSAAVATLLSRSHLGSEASGGAAFPKSVAQESFSLGSSLVSPLFQGPDARFGRRAFSDTSPAQKREDGKASGGKRR